MKKKRMRKLILLSLLILLIISGFYNLSIEPANYNKAISKEIDKANKLLKEANIGNDNGDYSKNTVIEMENNIVEAKNLIKKEAPDIDELREQYEKIKDHIKVFKNSYNRNSLSKEEVKKIKEENKHYTEKQDITSNTKIEWNISGENIEDIEPINLDIELNTVYEDNIKEFAEDNNMEITILSFRHNDDLPGKFDIHLHTSSKNEKKYLYKYDERSNQLIFKSKLEIKDDINIFKIEEGGDWVLSDKKIEAVKVKDESIRDEKKEDINNENKEEIKEDKESKDKEDSEVVSNIDKPNSSEKSSSDNSIKDTIDYSSSSSINSPSPKKNTKSYCIIEIRCDTILNNMDKLPKGKEKYIPKDGVILPPTKVEVKEGESVFDILKRVTRSKGIQMEFRNDPLYSGAYVEGINHLYEFDGGELSGWMYKVDGWFPEYGCSQYFVNSGQNRDRPGKTNGEVISWVYTCNLGKDVGDQDYWKYDN